MKKTSIVFYPNTKKRHAKNGKTPIYMRICFRGMKSETRLNVELSDEQLLKWDPFTMRMAQRNSPINHYLNRIDQKFSDLEFVDKFFKESIMNNVDLHAGHGEKLQTTFIFLTIATSN